MKFIIVLVALCACWIDKRPEAPKVYKCSAQVTPKSKQPTRIDSEENVEMVDRQWGLDVTINPQPIDFQVTDCYGRLHSLAEETWDGKMLHVWWDAERHCLEVQ
jgi:hypothetical protein